jgi:uncharacterized coiled-coil protein SlyX
MAKRNLNESIDNVLTKHRIDIAERDKRINELTNQNTQLQILIAMLEEQRDSMTNHCHDLERTLAATRWAMQVTRSDLVE